jgi:hypothetical protein
MAMIYLIDRGGQPIGPFENREAIERFVEMMALCGEDWTDNKIMEEGGNDAAGWKKPPQMDSCADPWKRANKLKLVGRRP